MASTPVRNFGSALRAAGFIHRTPKSLTASTLSLKPAAHSGRSIVVNRLAGATITLPASSGSGNRYRLVVGTTITSATIVLKVANATDVFVGGVLINDTGDSTAATVDYHPTASTSDTYTMTQSIGGGKVGDWVEVEDIASGKWAIHGVQQDVLDPTTPFSATVS